MDEDFGYTEARFLFCYLWVNKKMVPFVKSYLYELAPKYRGDLLNKMVLQKLESLLGKDINTIEKEYIAMAKKVKRDQKLYQQKG